MADTPFWSGKNARLVFILDNKKVELLPKTWKVKQNATLHSDGVGGEQRDRLSKDINYFEWTVSCFLKDLKPVMALLGYDAKIDTNTQPFEVGAGVLIYPNNGTRVGFEGREITIDDWDFDVNPGRSEKAMLQVPFRSQFFEPVPTI